MKKKFMALSAVIFFALVFMLSACSKNPNDKITVAIVDGEKITKTEYLETWENYKSYYGITQDIIDSGEYADEIEEIRKGALDSLVSQKITKVELENLGYYQLSEEDHESVKTQVDTVLDNLLYSMETEMYEELGDDYSEKDLAKAQVKYLQLALDEAGYDEEYIEDYFTYEIAMANAEIDLIDSTVSDEELLELFNQAVEEDKEFFSDLATYEYYVNNNDYQSYYVPEGLRMVRHVLIAFDDETITEIQNLRTEGSDEDADALVKTSLEAVYDEAFEALGKIKTEEITFDQAIEEYNDDPGMDSSPDGYMMSLESTSYVQEFTDAGMALENIGDVSDLVATDYGYHIIEYTSDVESGAIDFDTVKDALLEEATEEKIQDGWISVIEEWLAKHEIEYFYEELPEETVEETTEEATEEPTASAE